MVRELFARRDHDDRRGEPMAALDLVTEAAGPYDLQLVAQRDSIIVVVKNAYLALHSTGRLRHTGALALPLDGARLRRLDWRALFADDWTIVRSVTNPDEAVLLAVRGEVAVLYDTMTSPPTVEVSAPTEAELEAVLDEMRDRLDAQIGPAPERVTPIRVWWGIGRPSGPGSQARRLESLSWNDASANYPVAVGKRLERLMSYSEPEDESARLIFWHGEPGTGKTSAIRCLLEAWEPWCAGQYIANPDQFFASAEYISTVLTASRGVRPWGARGERVERPWSLIVAEDCDEYLRPQARGQAGASLGRLLNLTDGLLGRGMKVLVLLTTNEPLGRLHPAITRPGRCLDVTEFTPFTATEAASRLQRPVSEAMTLAEIYEQINGTAPPTTLLDDASTGHYL